LPVLVGKIFKIYDDNPNFTIITLVLPDDSQVKVKIFGGSVPTDKAHAHPGEFWPIEKEKLVVCFNLARNDYKGAFGLKVTPLTGIFNAEKKVSSWNFYHLTSYPSSFFTHILTVPFSLRRCSNLLSRICRRFVCPPMITTHQGHGTGNHSIN